LDDSNLLQPSGDGRFVPVHGVAAAAPVTGGDVLGIVGRRWKIALLTFAVVVGASFYLTSRMKPVYVATAQVYVDNPSRNSMPGSILELINPGNGAGLDTEMEVLRSRPVLNEVKKKSGLLYPIEELRQRIQFAPAPGGQIMTISAKGTTAKEAARLANVMMYVYMANVQAQRKKQSAATTQNLEEEMNGAGRRRMEKASDNLADFMARLGTSDPGEYFTKRTQQYNDVLVSLDEQRRELNLQRKKREKLVQQINTLPHTIVPGWVNRRNPVIDEYRKAIHDLETKRRQKLDDFTPESDEIREIDAEIGAKTKGIQEALLPGKATTRIAENVALNSDYTSALSQRIATDVSIEVAEAGITENKALLARLSPEQRRLATLRNQYEALLRVRESTVGTHEQLRRGIDDIRVKSATAEQRVRPLELALPPTAPRSPNPTLNALLSVALGAFLAVVMALYTEYLATAGRRRPETVTWEGLPRVAGLPVLASVPAAALPAPASSLGSDSLLPARTADANNGALNTEDALREIGYCLLHLRQTPAAPAPAVVLVGTRSGDESTAAVAAQLAATLVRDGLRVTLIDADRAQPRLNRVFGAPDAPGLADVLAGRARAQDVLHVGADGNLRFLAAGDPADTTPATEKGLRRVFADLRKNTDLVIVSGPSAFSVPAVAPLQRAADGVVLVTPPGAPVGESVARARRLLTNGYQPHLVGVVLGEAARDEDAAATAATVGPERPQGTAR